MPGKPASIPAMNSEELDRLEERIRKRREELRGQEAPPESPRAGSSYVVEYRPYQDGYLQSEMRTYRRKDGRTTERGPYWYFRYHAGGRQRTLYLGKTDEPEAVLAAKRT